MLITFLLNLMLNHTRTHANTHANTVLNLESHLVWEKVDFLQSAFMALILTCGLFSWSMAPLVRQYLTHVLI